MDTKEVLQSKKVRIGISVLGCLLIALVSFAGGMAVGIHKARYSYQWGQNYERNFMGSRNSGMMPMMRDFDGRGFRNPHGLSGTVVSVSGDTLIVKDRDNKENTVSVTDRTLIKYRGEDLKLTDLASGDTVAIIGKPGDNGVVNADIIRIFERGSQNAAPTSQSAAGPQGN